MSDQAIEIPQDYEIVKTIRVSDEVGEYVARHQADEAQQ